MYTGIKSIIPTYLVQITNDCVYYVEASRCTVDTEHEITHAFLDESGLQHCSSVPMGAWARHEEMVDWIAIQFPKIMKAFQEVGAL